MKGVRLNDCSKATSKVPIISKTYIDLRNTNKKCHGCFTGLPPSETKRVVTVISRSNLTTVTIGIFSCSRLIEIIGIVAGSEMKRGVPFCSRCSTDIYINVKP